MPANGPDGMLDLRDGRPVYVAGAVRTPIGKFGGGLRSLSAVELGKLVVAEALDRAAVPDDAVAETIIGHARQAGCGPNPARQVSVGAGIPDSSPAFTVNQACASGLKSIVLAAQSVALGLADVVVAGGMESMSNTPYLLPDMRWGARLGHARALDGQYQDGFLCPLSGDLMGRTAERLAEQYDISRTEQDAFAVRSQARAERARAAGHFDAEISPVEVVGRRETRMVEVDEHPRAGASLESLSRLQAVFKEGGTVHPGNSSGITDGAAALVVLSADALERFDVTAQARLLAATQAGVDPRIMGIGPVPAVRNLVQGTGVTLEQIDLVELNEAFAAQVIAVDRELGLDPDKLNVNGGAIALGHPIGCTGTRIVVPLVHELQRRGERLGLATLCVSGGMGTALLLERANVT